MEATIGELEQFVWDCDAAPMYPEQHPCIGISNDGPICTEARELFEKLKMEFGGAGEGGMDRSKISASATSPRWRMTTSATWWRRRSTRRRAPPWPPTASSCWPRCSAATGKALEGLWRRRTTPPWR